MSVEYTFRPDQIFPERKIQKPAKPNSKKQELACDFLPDGIIIKDFHLINSPAQHKEDIN